MAVPNRYQVLVAPQTSTNKPDQVLTSVSLGGSSMFSGFGSMGAKAKQQQPQFTSANAFSVLNNQDKKYSNMRRVTPSTSMERDRERQRMIQGVSEGEGRNSRGSSMQRERLQPASQPPSRDSSQPRQPVEDNREASHPKLDDKPAGHPEEQMTDEKLERHTVTIFEEYLQDLSSIEDIKLDLEQYYTGGRIEQFVEKALSISLDKKPPAQNKIGGLLTALLDYNVIPVSVFVNQLAFIYEAMDDIAIDVPKVWELQAHVVVPIIAAEKVNFGHFKEACKPIQRTKAVPKLLVPVLQFLSKAMGEGFARKMWDLSNVSITDFMAEEGADVNAFIKEHSLDFLVGEAPKCDQPSMDQFHEKMLKLMKITGEGRDSQSSSMQGLQQPEKQMTWNELDRHTVTIFEEYLQDLITIEDIKLDLKLYYTRGWIARFVEEALSISLDKKPPAQYKIGGLLAALLDYNVIPVSVFINQLGFIYEMVDDIAIYDPRVWKLQAHVVVPIIATEKFNFGHFKEACKHIQRTNTVPKLLVPVLQFLSKAKGEGFARQIWNLSNVSIKDFMAEEGADMNAFIKEHSLDFLVGEAPKCDQPSFD